MQLATNLAYDELEKIAKHLDTKISGFKNPGYTRNGKNRYQFTLKPTSDKNRKLGFYNARSNAVSFQGYTQFMRDVFKKDKQAEFKTMYGKINPENISEMEEVVGNKNIGSMMEPRLFNEAQYTEEAAKELRERHKREKEERNAVVV